MNVYTYQSKRGKDLIYSYINSLSKYEKIKATKVLERIERNNIELLTEIGEPLRGKIYEVRSGDSRFGYVVNKNDVYILHAFKKEKNKTESRDLDILITRAKELGQELGLKFI